MLGMLDSRAVFGQRSLSCWAAMWYFLVSFIIKQMVKHNALIAQLSKSCEFWLWLEMKRGLVSCRMLNLPKTRQLQILPAKHNLSSIIGRIFALLLITKMVCIM